MSTTSLEPAISLRRRTNPLETARREAMSKTPSRLPSPPEDNDASSDDTIMPQGRHHSGGDIGDHFSAGSGVVGSDRKHEFPSIASRLHPSTPSHSQSPSTIRTRSHSSSSDSDSDTGGLTDAAHTIASSTSWSDLPLLVTLVPPIVALFTGGDYLRDLLLTCFLVWYLHQIIKVPWDIYLASLPPPRTSHQPTQHKELRTTRIAALLLCAVTPFLGATLLRLVASYLYPSDPEPLSWFSTALFVLAAGIRPWRHLAHLVLTRTEALHLAAHKPSIFRAALLAPEIEHRERARDAQRIDSLESELAQLRAELSVLTERTRSATRHVKALEQALNEKVETVQGRVEVLERYGSTAGGAVGGWELIWRGFGKLVCAAFPFTKSWFEEAEAEAGRGRRVKGKKGKRLRGVVNNLPPVPEVDEHEGKVHGSRPSGVADVRPNGLNEKRGANSDSGVLPSLPKPDGFIMWTINLATWPLRVMRGILTGFVGIFRS